MPPNILPKPRTWGTRFDPLPSSPPSSPRPIEVQNETGTRVPSEVADDQSIMPFRRTDERVHHEASIFVGRQVASLTLQTSTHLFKSHYHSLPSSVDQRELARLLSEHLQDHSEIRNTKVVRDSKGGLCAFVQCEVRPVENPVLLPNFNPSNQDAASASQLIRTLKSSEPRPFLGRFLRYEPARAFKTLFISYR
jgi:hypothetical protein